MRRADIEVPNHPVDMDSWGRSACYPRGTFYPLSYDPSTRDRRITRALFRDCSTCRSRSKAGLCSCTLGTVSIRAEPTFALLRYSFGGDRPSQTAQLTLFTIRIHGFVLDFKQAQGGISTSAHRTLACPCLRLPPILHKNCLKPISAYSKGSWGLSV